MREATTFLEAVRGSLAHAARYDPGDVVAPVVVLWTDADGQWSPVVNLLRSLMPGGAMCCKLASEDQALAADGREGFFGKRFTPGRRAVLVGVTAATAPSRASPRPIED